MSLLVLSTLTFSTLTFSTQLGVPDWTAEGGQAAARLGGAVAAAGDVNGDGYPDVLVGAEAFDGGQTDEGKVYLYLGSATGLAASPAWTAEGEQDGAEFGAAVATAGDVNGDGYSDVLVGARRFDGGQTDEGKAYLYLGSPSGLATSPAWTAESNQAGALLGHALATAGDVNGDGYSDVLVGAWQYDESAHDEGGVLLYLGSAAGLAPFPSWSVEGGQAGAHFGYSVFAAGDTNGDGFDDVIVGSPGFSNGQLAEGRAAVFAGSPAGLSAEPVWTVESDQAGALLGNAVSTAGDVNGDGYADVLVGAWLFDDGETDEGRVYAFLGSAVGLATSASWTKTGGQANAHLGSALATAGDWNGDGLGDALLGADAFDGGGGGIEDGGRAFLYLGRGNFLAPTPAWTAEGEQSHGRFGYALAGVGDVDGDGHGDVLVGAHLHDGDLEDEGRVSAFHGAAAGLATREAWTIVGENEIDFLGASVASAGDVNGDGYGDVVIGSPLYEDGQSNEGRVLVHHGSAAGLSPSPDWTYEPDRVNAQLGHIVDSAGDVNGDGFGDVLVQSSNSQGLETLVFLGSAEGLAASPAWIVPGGNPAASAGDVDGDGFGDIVVGADHFVAGYAVSARVYLGSPAGLDTNPAWSSVFPMVGYGELHAGAAGDVDGDGYGDVIVGNTWASLDGGRAYLYRGSAAGLATSPAWTAVSSLPTVYGDRFGVSVGTAGDVNGDGFSDVIVGAEFAQHAFVYTGSPQGLSAAPATALTLEGAQVFGCSVATAGDVNADGYSDVIVGDYSFDGCCGPGRAFTFLGAAAGLSTVPAWTGQDTFGGAYGWSSASAGDVNGDGYGDVIVGDQFHRANSGGAFVYLGNEGRGGWVRDLHQRRKGGARPIARLGLTGSDGQFRIHAELQARLDTFAWASPAPTTVALEWEVKPTGVPFDGLELERSPGQVAAGTTLVFDELTVAGFTRGHALHVGPRGYHWRARLVSDHPLFPNSAWFGQAGSAITEAKLRRRP